jgi:hypothetical protein
MYKLLNDVNVIKSCYEFFKSVPNMDKFGSLSIPSTEYQNDLKEMSLSPIEMWLKDYILENYYEKEPIKLYGKEQYELFNVWIKKCGMDYNCNLPAFGLRLKNLKIDGILHNGHGKQGKSNLFDIQIMRKHFGLENDLIIDTD